jgi:hypothetical protein
MNINSHIIPAHLQPYFELRHNEIPVDHLSIFNSIAEALTAIDGRININKKYTIILDKSPFELSVCGTNELTCKTDNDTICLVVGDMIFLDYLKLSSRPPQEKIAIILEELVHAVMNVADETLVKEIVCLLYPQASHNKARGYHPAAHSRPECPAGGSQDKTPCKENPSAHETK